MIERQSLRLASLLLVLGELLFIGAGLLHPAREPANEHRAVFLEYAQSGNWIAVHLGQFVGAALLLAGLLVLGAALFQAAPRPGWSARFAMGSALVTLALTAALQGVDGVALKHAVDAWQAAPAPEQPVAFANAEVVRWLEWAVRSYQRLLLGVTWLLIGMAILESGSLARVLGVLALILGVDYGIQGWIVGTEGFAPAAAAPTLLGLGLELGWVIWVGLLAWRLAEPILEPGSPTPTSARNGKSSPHRR